MKSPGLGQRLMEWPPLVAIYESRLWRRSFVFARAAGISFDEEIRRIGEAAGIERASRVLDLACGSGIYSRPFARQLSPGRVVGLDLSSPMLAQARRRASGEGLTNVDLVRGSALGLPFAAGIFDFNGDGMMAVFGAPRKLTHKERAAVEAGREIVEAVGALPIEGGETRLSVGVGIATGDAFVGNIQAVDRMIWSAIGNTTNLAARLQALTRELDAAIVIDTATWARAQAAAEGFEQRADVPIRGRRETQDLYALPLPSAVD